jgi:hypothetical protein
MKLLEGISPSAIAHQYGTSAEMIRLHCSHLTAQMFKKELIGNESGELTKLVRKCADLEYGFA